MYTSSSQRLQSPATFNLGEVSDGLCLSPFFAINSLSASASFPTWIIGDRCEAGCVHLSSSRLTTCPSSFLLGVYSVPLASLERPPSRADPNFQVFRLSPGPAVGFAALAANFTSDTLVGSVSVTTSSVLAVAEATMRTAATSSSSRTLEAGWQLALVLVIWML